MNKIACIKDIIGSTRDYEVILPISAEIAAMILKSYHPEHKKFGLYFAKDLNKDNISYAFMDVNAILFHIYHTEDSINNMVGIQYLNDEYSIIIIKNKKTKE